MTSSRKILNALFLSLLTVLISCNSAINTNTIKIGLISNNEYVDNETEALRQLLNSKTDIDCIIIPLDEILNNNYKLSANDIIWYHRTDSSEIKDNEKQASAVILNYLENGGNIILSMDAVKLLNSWGVEENTIEKSYVNISDEGFGRKMGFHSFISHPLFKNLSGGAYIWHPDHDLTERRLGFFNNSVPKAEGSKIIGIDWAYINYLENSKLLWETPFGKGKILACGAYTHYSSINFNKKQLQQFTFNMVDYLSSPLNSYQALNWDYSEAIISNNKSDNRISAGIKSKSWNTGISPLVIMSEKTDSRYDLAGERITFFGKEKAGIDEIWIHPIMSFRDIRVGVVPENEENVLWFDQIDPIIENRVESLIRKYNIRGTIIKEIVCVDKQHPLGVIHYEWDNDNIKSLVISMKSNLRLMWPYSQETTGIINWDWNKNNNSLKLHDRNEQNKAIVVFSDSPDNYEIGRYETIETGNQGFITKPTDKLQLAAAFIFNTSEKSHFDMCFSGSIKSEGEPDPELKELIQNPEKILVRSGEYYTKLFNERLIIETDDTLFNNGYKWALASADQFKVNTPGIGKSLMAGYASTDYGWSGNHSVSGRPGYAWYFGRDAEWSGLTFNALGDYSIVKNILLTFNKYMDLNGKIYHELTTSGSVHYDAADATPLYIILSGQYIKYSGDTKYLEDNIDYFRRAMDYCFSTDTDNDGLIENTSVGHGWIEGGELYGAHTTLYLAGLWGKALDEAAYLEEITGNNETAIKYREEAKRVRKIIDTKFWNEEKEFYHYGLNADGSMCSEITVLPAVPILFGQTDIKKSLSVVKMLNTDNFSSDWGVRILRKESKLYNPAGYHYGSVWPLFTGWSSMAEFRSGKYVQGFIHAMNNLLIYQDWDKGSIEEVLNGEIYEPSGVCSHQCWSETMALHPLIDGLLGLEPDALNNEMKMTPHFPASWNNASVKNISLGKSKFNCTYKRTDDGYKLLFTLTKGDNLSIAIDSFIPEGSLTSEISIDEIIYNTCEAVKIQLSESRSTCTLYVKYSGGIELLPPVRKPVPGETSSGIRILNNYFSNDSYIIDIQKPANSESILNIRYKGMIDNISGASIINRNRDLIELSIPATGTSTDYISGQVKIILKR